MHALDSRAGRYLATERGAFDDPPKPGILPAGGPGSHGSSPLPLFPLAELARIDWQSLVSTFARLRFYA